MVTLLPLGGDECPESPLGLLGHSREPLGGAHYFVMGLEVQAFQVVSTDTTVGRSILLLAEANASPSSPLGLL